jgi:hypoxanthine phosphoribosyltransferase
MERVHLTWKDIEDAIESIAYRVSNSGIEINSITGLPRGGMIPAIMLSHKMNIPFQTSAPTAPGNVLIVDDICDSGETLRRFKHEKRFYTATIHHKQTAAVEPTFWYSLVKEGDWIVYPWEREDSKAIQDYLNKKKTIFNNKSKTVFD